MQLTITAFLLFKRAIYFPERLGRVPHPIDLPNKELWGNQELLVVTDKVGRPPGELGVSKFMECDIFPSVL